MDGRLKMGDRRLGPALCRVTHCAALPKHMHARTREVKALHVAPAERGKGYGTSLMHKLCREADADNMILVLMPRGFADAAWTDEQLAGWYEQFGFQVIQREPAVLMARAPGSTPRLLALSPVAASMYAERFGKAHQ